MGREKQEEHAELDPERHQVGNHDRDRNHQAVKVDLSEQAGVGDECPRDAVERVGEVAPQDSPGQVEEEGRRPVRGQAGDLREDHRERQCGEQRLDDVPARPEDGLLVDGNEVSPDEEGDEVAISPQLAETPIEPAPVGPDHRGRSAWSSRRCYDARRSWGGWSVLSIRHQPSCLSVVRLDSTEGRDGMPADRASEDETCGSGPGNLRTCTQSGPPMVAPAPPATSTLSWRDGVIAAVIAGRCWPSQPSGSTPRCRGRRHRRWDSRARRWSAR